MSEPAATWSSDPSPAAGGTMRFTHASGLCPASAAPLRSASFWSEEHWTPRKDVTLSIREWHLTLKTSTSRYGQSNLHQYYNTYNTSIAAWKSHYKVVIVLGPCCLFGFLLLLFWGWGGVVFLCFLVLVFFFFLFPPSLADLSFVLLHPIEYNTLFLGKTVCP